MNWPPKLDAIELLDPDATPPSLAFEEDRLIVEEPSRLELAVPCCVDELVDGCVLKAATGDAADRQLVIQTF